MVNQPPISPEWAEKGKRRSFRVLLSVPVLVEIQGGKSAASEETHTLVVNAHGALLVLAVTVAIGQELELTNRQTRTKEQCRVVYLGPPHEEKTQVGVEFLKPSPSFWPINFPPNDWRSSSSS